MLRAARTRKVKSAIDTSDGVLACLQLLGKESDVSFLLHEDLVHEVIDPEVSEIEGKVGRVWFPQRMGPENATHERRPPQRGIEDPTCEMNGRR